MRRTLLAPVVAAALAAVVLNPVQPAQASTGPAVSVKVNETKLIHGAAINGISTQFQAVNTPDYYPVGQVAATTPADCTGEPVGCVTIPLTLEVPEDDPDLLEAAAYLLTVTVSWDSGQSVENLPQRGTFRQNELESFLYQDPQTRNSSGTATWTSASHNNNPAVLTSVAPTSRKFNLVVANYFGVNTGYTLEISLIKSSIIDFDPSDYVKHDSTYTQPVFTPPPSSTPQGNGIGGGSLPPVTPSTGGQPPAVEGGAAPIVVPNIANGRPDAGLLASSQLVRPSGLGLHAVKVSSTVVSDAVAKSGTTKIVLTLTALPGLAVLVALLLLRRRKKDAAATIAAT